MTPQNPSATMYQENTEAASVEVFRRLKLLGTSSLFKALRIAFSLGSQFRAHQVGQSSARPRVLR